MKKIFLSLLLIVAFAAPAFSQTMDMPMKGHMGCMGHMMDMPMKGNMAGMGHMMHMCDMEGMCNMAEACLDNAGEIALSDEQLKKIKAIHRDMQKKLAHSEADLKVAKLEFSEIMEVKDFDLGKADIAIRKMADMMTALHLEMLKSMKEVRAVLTDEQFEKIMKIHMRMGMMHPILGEKMIHPKMGKGTPAKKTMKK